ncbi:MAG: UvrD-helicase domain-containing protein [Fidelibacterota bacterium]
MNDSPLKRALNVHRSVFIQACAGAGKTFSLTKRYAAVLDQFAKEAQSGVPFEDIDPRRILVITFTKKAAGEMASRIYGDVNKLLSGDKIPGMESQNIDFCPVLRTVPDPSVRDYAQYLKERFSQHAIATIDSFCAGILREFAHRAGLDPQFSGQDEAQSEQLLELHLERWLKKKAEMNSDELNALLENMSVYRIRKNITGIYRHREILQGHLSQFRLQHDEDIWRDWLKRYTPDYNEKIIIGGFESLYKNAERLCTDKKDKLYELLQHMYANYIQIQHEDPLECRSAFLTEVIRKSALVTGKDEYRKSINGDKKKWSDGKKEAVIWFETLKNSIPVEDLMGTPGPEDYRIIPLLRKLFDLYRDFDACYLDVRKKKNVLDFSDIILFTHKLLRHNPDIRKTLAERYRHIMVDEFQDTNPIRWEIIRSIFQSEEDADAIQLFIVGDRKQSIYRFNNADVTVMDDAEELIRQKGGEILDFNDNYRSSPDFIDKGINAVFGGTDIMPEKGKKEKAYEAFFDPTVYKGRVKNRLSPAVETFWCSAEAKRSGIYLPAQHAAFCVREKLRELQQAGMEGSADKPLIGVLLRKFSHIEDYLQAFRMLDIPVSIIGGRGFYQTGVSRDVFHFLSVLDNPFDDHALAGLLRSPLVALPDTKIHLLAARDRGISLFEAMGKAADPVLRKTRELILSWIGKSRYMSADILLTRIIEENDRELGYISELMPRQRLANMDKAINIIRGMVRKGSNLRTIREHFHYRVNNNTNEAQALYPETAKVHILTVHKAKGLEFPVVVMPEMNASGGSNTESFQFGRKDGYFEMSLSLPGKERSGILYGLKKNAQHEETAEEKRVFYVAFTRAVHKVCFLGEETERSSKNTWWNTFIREIHNLDEKDDLEKWKGKGIHVHDAAEVITEGRKAVRTEKSKWIEAPSFSGTGSYRYCTPHDLMENGSMENITAGRGEAGLATGSCYHWCLEYRWFDINAHRKELENRLNEEFPEVETEKVLKECRILLDRTIRNPLYKILNDPHIEKYQELSLSGWLGKGDDLLRVNGKIDLLYRRNEKWFIIDFKTDAGTENLDSYKQQIRTYQWMIKQAYGIDAAGKLYFVRRDEHIDVEEDSNYFNNLPQGTGYHPRLPRAQVKAEKIIPELDRERTILFCPSAYHAEQVFLSLARQRMLRPSIRITTPGKWLQRSTVSCLSGDHLRMMILKEGKNASRGFSELMAAAIRNTELSRGKLQAEFHALYQHISGLRSAAGFASEADLYRDPALRDFPGDTKVGFIDLQPPAPLQFELEEQIKKKTEHFSASMLPRTSTTNRYSCIEAFSPREEVIAVAKEIISSGLDKPDILIAVSSMDKYAELIKRLFPQFGLSFRFIDSPTADTILVATLLLDLLYVVSLTDPDWDDIAPLFLHPLCRPDERLWEYDIFCRRHPESDCPPPDSIQAVMKKITGPDINELPDIVDDFLETVQCDPGDDEDSVSAIESFHTTLKEVLRDIELLGFQSDIRFIYREMCTRLQNKSIRRKTHNNGIPVVGYLDSLGLNPKQLFVMGMAEGDIPRRETSNPYFIPDRYYSLILNRHFMENWLQLGNKVTFSYSRHGEDGSEQQRSAFLEELPLKMISAGTSGSRRRKLLYYENRPIEGDFLLAQRHNEILSGNMDNFSGQVNDRRNIFQIPVSAVDTLLACPMRFYYDRILRVQPGDEDESAYRAKTAGTVIHAVLEDFGKKGGFSFSTEQAVDLMKTSIEKIFTEANIDKNDPLIRDRFRYYILNLEKDSKVNCLVSLLEWNKKTLWNYRAVSFEKSFSPKTGDPLQLKFGDVEVSISGIIDKIMINETLKNVIVSDYKTGNIQSDFKEYMRAQLYLYTLKAQEMYPGYTADAAYEQIKKPKIHGGGEGLSLYTLNDGKFGKIKKNGEEFSGAINVRTFHRLLEKLFSLISVGSYYITDRTFETACKHCPHAGLCRKDSRLRHGHDNGPSGLIYGQGENNE